MSHHVRQSASVTCWTMPQAQFTHTVRLPTLQWGDPHFLKNQLIQRNNLIIWLRIGSNYGRELKANVWWFISSRYMWSAATTYAKVLFFFLSNLRLLTSISCSAFMVWIACLRIFLGHCLRFVVVSTISSSNWSSRILMLEPKNYEHWGLL